MYNSSGEKHALNRTPVTIGQIHWSGNRPMLRQHTRYNQNRPDHVHTRRALCVEIAHKIYSFLIWSNVCVIVVVRMMWASNRLGSLNEWAVFSKMKTENFFFNGNLMIELYVPETEVMKMWVMDFRHRSNIADDGASQRYIILTKNNHRNRWLL